MRLFANSNIADLTNFESLKDWKFYEDNLFYIVIAITGVYGLTVLLVTTVLKKYCAVEKIKKKREKDYQEPSSCSIFVISFAVKNEVIFF